MRQGPTEMRAKWEAGVRQTQRGSSEEIEGMRTLGQSAQKKLEREKKTEKDYRLGGIDRLKQVKPRKFI